jgi:hypothetical protein
MIVKYINMSHGTFMTAGESIPITKPLISQSDVAGNYCHIGGRLSVNINVSFIDNTVLEQTDIA